MDRNHGPVHRYVDGTSYRMAKGSALEQGRSLGQSERIGQEQVTARQIPVEDNRQWHRQMAIVDLTQKTTPGKFLAEIERELRIRCYSPRSKSAYMSCISSFLRWSGLGPHEIERCHVREFLDVLVCADAAPNTVALYLSAIRTAWDKFCFCDVTLGLVTPRRRRRLPVVLSESEVERLLRAATNQRDKLVIGLMYATGMRVSEVVRVRCEDVDLHRSCIFVRQGKGKCDRMVALPNSFRRCLGRLTEMSDGRAFLFCGERKGRHLSTRTVQRLVRNTAVLAGINKSVTPHSLRHSYATHSFQNGYDIRLIQKALGHVRLETTTIYVKVAGPGRKSALPCPLDQLQDRSRRAADDQRPSVGSVRIHCKGVGQSDRMLVTLEILGCKSNERVFLTGVVASLQRPGFWAVEFPPLEKWQPALSLLGEQQRQRILEPEFYLTLQRHIGKRIQRMRSGELVRRDRKIGGHLVASVGGSSLPR